MRSILSDWRLRAIKTMMAIPTGASAAATTITKNTNACPERSCHCRLNATNARFTALSMSSMDMKIVMMFRLNTKPTTPSPNKIALSTMQCEARSTIVCPPPALAPANSYCLLIALGQNHRSQARNQNQYRRQLERKHQMRKEQTRERPRLVFLRDHSRNPGGHDDPHAIHQHCRERQAQRHAEKLSRAAELRALILTGVEQHDDEHTQHHDGARIHDDLYGGQQLGAEQQI